MNQNPGQKQLREMTARAQKQVADQNQRNMQIAWMMKQQEEARQRSEDAQSSKGSGQSTAGWQSGGYFQADERFSQVEAEVARLNQQLAAGQLNQEKFNEQLKSLMVQDSSGDWWMVGASTGAWYRFDGQNWTQSTPPGRWVQGSSPPVNSVPSRFDFTRPKGHHFGAVMLFFFLLIVVAAAGFAVGWFIDGFLKIHGETSLYIAIIVWGIGLIWAFIRARHTWRGY